MNLDLRSHLLSSPPQLSCLPPTPWTCQWVFKTGGFLLCATCSVMSDSFRPRGLYSLPASSFHGILQARILEWVVISYSRGSSWPRDQTHVSCVSCIADGSFTYWAIREAHCSISSIALLLFIPAMITIDLVYLFPKTRSFQTLPLLPFLPYFNPPMWNFETILNHTRIKSLPSLKIFGGFPVLLQTMHKLFLQAVTNTTPHFPNTALLFWRDLPLPQAPHTRVSCVISAAFVHL